MAGVAISLGCYRIQKPLKSGNTKKIRKNYKITHFRFGPKNTKKLPKNYKNGHFLANFVIFRDFFRIFGAKPEMGDLVIFSYFFRISRFEGFLYSVAPQGDRKAGEGSDQLRGNFGLEKKIFCPPPLPRPPSCRHPRGTCALPPSCSENPPPHPPSIFTTTRTPPLPPAQMPPPFSTPPNRTKNKNIRNVRQGRLVMKKSGTS